VYNNEEPLVLYTKEEVDIYEVNKTKVTQCKECITEWCVLISVLAS
jgi:hypothetical protein